MGKQSKKVVSLRKQSKKWCCYGSKVKSGVFMEAKGSNEKKMCCYGSKVKSGVVMEA